MKTLKFLLTLFLIALAISCEKRNVETTSYESLPSGLGIIPYYNGGNGTCGEDFISIKADYVNGKFIFESPATGWPEGLSVTVINGTYVSFTLSPTSPFCVAAVIVKGGNGNNKFVYNDPTLSDNELSAPINPSGKPAELSNLTFCFTECRQRPSVVVAVKSWIWLSSTSMEENNWADYKFTMSTGPTVFQTGNYCDALGIINYPETNSSTLTDGRGTINIEEVDVNNVHYLKIIVDLNEGLVFESTSLYVGNLDGLTGGPLSTNTYTLGCPLYESWPYQEASKVNTHTFYIPY
jgi:hypothetical protein